MKYPEIVPRVLKWRQYPINVCFWEGIDVIRKINSYTLIPVQLKWKV